MKLWDINYFDKASLRLFTLLLLLFSMVIIKGEAMADPPRGCYDIGQDDTSIGFFVNSTYGDYELSSPVELGVWSDTLLMAIHMDVKWDSTKLVFDSVDFSPWREHFPADEVETGYNLINSGNVSLEILNIDNQIIYQPGVPVVKIWFKLKCLAVGNSTEIFYNGRCPLNHVVKPGGAEYGPQIFSGTVTMSPLYHNVIPLGDTSLINDTTIVTALLASRSMAWDGFISNWEYPKDKLRFLGAKKGRILPWDIPSNWVFVDSINNPATIHIIYAWGVNCSTIPDTFYYLYFKNIMTANHDSAKVTMTSDSLKICHAADYSVLYSILTDTVSTNVLTDYNFKAILGFKNTSYPKNSYNVNFPIQLQNNFCIKMTGINNLGVTRLQIYNNKWSTSLIQYSGQFANVNGWHWVQEAGANAKFKNDISSTSDISSSSWFKNICIPKVNTQSNIGTQVANILRENTYLKYCDTTVNLTIHDSLDLELQPGTFTVTEPPPGCPFVYVWNGSEFVEDNTILAASEINPGKPVDDYYLLSKILTPEGNKYRLQIREFENEVSYIDQINLIAVDHTSEVKVAVTAEGRIFGYDKALVPVACVDQFGKDHLAEVKDKDGVYFASEEPGYLILTYSKKTGFPDVLYDHAPGPGPTLPDKRAGIVSNVSVEVQDINGEWHNLGNVPPRFYPDRSSWILDADGVALGDDFKVKISWDKYYSADELKYFTCSKENPLGMWNSPASAVNSVSGEMLKELSEIDESFATLSPGQNIELTFPVSSGPEPGLVRDFVLQTRGYYISLNKQTVLPTSYELLNNYPNPFNPSTVILYTLPEATDVKLEIYNVLGQRVRVLVKGHQSPGYKTMVWDGKNDKRENVSSGIYFYKLETQDYSNSKKMLLMR